MKLLESILPWRGRGRNLRRPKAWTPFFEELEDRVVLAAPIAVADAFAVNQNEILNVAAAGVLANDTDPESDPLTATLTTGPANGALALNADGSFTYTPNAGFFGTDSFTYKAFDGGFNSNIATVTITVNAQPVALNDANAVDEDTILSVIAIAGVLTNDSDFEGSPLSAILTTGTVNGALALNADGSFTYTPSPNFNGTDSFTYKAFDGSVIGNIATVTITVNPINDLPVASGDAFSVNEDATLTVAAAGVLINDSDVDGDILTAALVTGTVNGALVLNADGSFEYAPNPDFNGTDSFTYKANDGVSNSNVATVSITINPINDAPVNGVPGPQVTNEDTALVFSVGSGNAISISDVDAGSAAVQVTLTATNGTMTLSGTTGLSFITGDGTNDPSMVFTGTITNINSALDGLTFSPTANFNGTASLQIITDDQGNTGLGGPLSDTDTIGITVNPINDPPVAYDDANTTGLNTAITGAATVLVNDTDPVGDGPGPLSVDVASQGVLATANGGSATLNADGTYDYLPPLNFVGTDTFTYKVFDGGMASLAPATVSIIVTNQPPVANNDSNTTPFYTSVSGNVLSNDTDPDSGPVGLNVAAADTGVSVTANGSVTLNADGTYDYTPNAGFFGTDSFTYSNTDGDLISLSVATVSITITPQFLVTNTNDSGAGSLRQAIIYANANAGFDTIAFDIPGPGPHTIKPLIALPTITDSVIIDGWSEPDFAGTPIIELDGSLAGATSIGLWITAGDSTVRGLVINRFGDKGIRLSPAGGNIIEGNYIGTNTAGTVALANGGYGITITSAANRIGTNGDGVADIAERNIISGNSGFGVYILGAGADNNVVAGNYIGTDVTGTIALANGWDGVRIYGAAKFNIIGTNGDGINDAAERNIISGNALDGVIITDVGTDNNVVAGNYIGTDVTGTVALGNGSNGINISSGAKFNRIGTDGDGIADIAERNIISGNAWEGVSIEDVGTNNNIVAGNYIGTDVTGAVTLGNLGDGVSIEFGAQLNRIGTDGDGIADIAERNIISGNAWTGVIIEGAGASNNIVAGNYIGTDVTGTASVANGFEGVLIAGGAQSNLIGTNGDGVADIAERNIISGNANSGVNIIGTGTDNNLVAGNFIGTDVTGALSIGNGGMGIRIQNGSFNIIGTNGDGLADISERNIISGNSLEGVNIQGIGADNNVVAGNYIGIDVTGSVVISNAGYGIWIKAGAQLNRIGTDGDGLADIDERNIISGNVRSGVHLNDVGTDNNIVAGNYIGTDVTGSVALGNSLDGILISFGPQFNVFGGALASQSNTINFNGGSGLVVNAGVGRTNYTGMNANSQTTHVLIGTLQVNSNNAIATTSAVIVSVDGILDLFGFATAAGSLTLTSGSTNGAKVLSTVGVGTLTLGGNVTLLVSGTGDIGAAINGGNLDLGLSSRTFTINDGAAAGDLFISANISGAAGLGIDKVGLGMLILAGANTYSGLTSVNAGALLVDGSLAGPVTVNPGGILGGSGMVGTITSLGGTVSPGTVVSAIDTAILGSKDLALDAASIFDVQLNGLTAGANYDQLAVTGTVALGGATLNATLGFGPNLGDTFTIIDNDGTDPVGGTFAGLAEAAIFLIGSNKFGISYVGGDGNDVVLTAVNSPPVAMNDAYVVAEDTSLVVPSVLGVLGNDSEPDGQSMTAVLASGPANGSLILNADGSFAYTGNLDFFGVDSFTYMANDGMINGNVATVTITVNPVEDDPRVVGAGIGNIFVSEDAANTLIDLFAIFHDPETPDSLLSFTIVANTNPGLFTSPPVPVAGTLTLDYAPNANGTADITVRATDTASPTPRFVDTTFTVTVGAVNDTPTTTGIADVVVPMSAVDTVINLFGIFGDVEDPDSALTLAIQSVSNRNVFTGVTIDPATGQLTLDYADNTFGTSMLTIRATDTGGLFVDASFTVTVGTPGQADSLEPNDTTGAATNEGSLAIGTTNVRTANIHDAADVDFYQFDVSAFARLRVEIIADREGSTFDSVLTLYDSGGTELISNDDQAGLDSFLEILVPSGTYFVEVAGYGGSIGSYRLEITPLDPGPQPMRLTPFKTVTASPTSLKIRLDNNDLVGATVAAAAYVLEQVDQNGNFLANHSTQIAGASYDAAADEITLTVAGVLPDGRYKLTVPDTITSTAGKAIDGDRNGHAGGNFVRFFGIDTTADVSVLQLAGTAGADAIGSLFQFTGTINEPYPASDGEPLIVELDVDGDGFDDGQVSVTRIGISNSFVIESTTGIAAGQSVVVRAQVTDVRGNVSAPASVTVNTAAPLVDEIKAVGNTIQVVFSQAVNNAAVLTNYEILDGNSLTYTISSISYDSPTRTATLNFASLPDDSYTVTVKDPIVNGSSVQLDGDVNGTPGGDHIETLLVDSVTPVITSFSLAAASDTGFLSNDDLTNIPEPTFEFVLSDIFPTATGQVTIRLDVDGDGFDDGEQTFELPIGNSGNPVILTLPTLSPLADGTSTVLAQVEDAAGNIASISLLVTLDRDGAMLLPSSTQLPIIPGNPSAGVRFTLDFSENLDPVAAVDPDIYSLVGASGDRDFFNNNEVDAKIAISSITYQNVGTNGQIIVDIDIVGNSPPLLDDDYRLTVLAASLTDPAGNPMAGEDIQVQFQFDRVSPVVLTSILDSVNPNVGPDRLLIQFPDVDFVAGGVTNLANYRFEDLGSGQVLPLAAPHYDPYGDRVILSGFGELGPGTYQLTVFATPSGASPGSTGIANLLGLNLDCDVNCLPGGDYGETFVITAAPEPLQLDPVILDGNANSLDNYSEWIIDRTETIRKELTDASFAEALLEEVRLAIATVSDNATSQDVADAVNLRLQSAFLERRAELGFDPGDFLLVWGNAARFVLHDPADDLSLLDSAGQRVGFDFGMKPIERLGEAVLAYDQDDDDDDELDPEGLSLAIVPVNAAGQLFGTGPVSRLDSGAVVPNLKYLLELEGLEDDNQAGVIHFAENGQQFSQTYANLAEEQVVTEQIDLLPNSSGFDRELDLTNQQVIDVVEAVFGPLVNFGDNVLIIWFDPIDFVLTDAQTSGQIGDSGAGMINSMPGAFYSGNGETEMLVIPNATAGIYQLSLAGLGGTFRGTASFISGGQITSVPMQGTLGSGEGLVALLDFRQPAGTTSASGLLSDTGGPDSLLGIAPVGVTVASVGSGNSSLASSAGAGVELAGLRGASGGGWTLTKMIASAWNDFLAEIRENVNQFGEFVSEIVDVPGWVRTFVHIEAEPNLNWTVLVRGLLEVFEPNLMQPLRIFEYLQSQELRVQSPELRVESDSDSDSSSNLQPPASSLDLLFETFSGDDVVLLRYGNFDELLSELCAEHRSDQTNDPPASSLQSPASSLPSGQLAVAVGLLPALWNTVRQRSIEGWPGAIARMARRFGRALRKRLPWNREPADEPLPLETPNPGIRGEAAHDLVVGELADDKFGMLFHDEIDELAHIMVTCPH